MRWAFLAVVVAVVLIGLTGCAPVGKALGGAINWMFGIDDGDGTKPPTGDPGGGPAGSILNTIIPGAGGLLAAIILEIKRRQAKRALVASFNAIEAESKANPDSEIKERLASSHTAAGVYSFVHKILDSEGINKPEAKPAGG